MRKISVSNCEPGMILGKAIFHNGTVILLEIGTELTLSYVDRLRDLGITEIYIEDDISKDVVIHDVVKDETRLEAIEFIKNTMNAYISGEMPYSIEAIAVVNKIVNDILSSDDIIVNIIDIKTFDNYTFLHSVNVCVLSIITGVKLNLCYDELKELGVGALLHDIGKVFIPPEILQKKAALTEFEYESIKQHSLLGYNILKSLSNISENSARVALNHHERCDGSGYPNGLHDDEIHIFSRIVAITDMFDALTSDRIYRKKINTDQAIEYLTAVAAPSLDSKVLYSFTNIISPFPVGTGVILNTGEKGLVIQQNENLPTRPVIRIVFGKDGSKRFIFDEVNLAERKDYFIISSAELIK
ncbi:MAG TPA: HD-GYP domain-containing protein [Ruminiclostridium sp.]